MASLEAVKPNTNVAHPAEALAPTLRTYSPIRTEAKLEDHIGSTTHTLKSERLKLTSFLCFHSY